MRVNTCHRTSNGRSQSREAFGNGSPPPVRRGAPNTRPRSLPERVGVGAVVVFPVCLAHGASMLANLHPIILLTIFSRHRVPHVVHTTTDFRDESSSLVGSLPPTLLRRAIQLSLTSLLLSPELAHCRGDRALCIDAAMGRGSTRPWSIGFHLFHVFFPPHPGFACTEYHPTPSAVHPEEHTFGDLEFPSHRQLLLFSSAQSQTLATASCMCVFGGGELVAPESTFVDVFKDTAHMI